MRVWLTASGKHVLEGDPDAAFLAYGEGDPLPAKVAAEVKVKAEVDAPKAEAKKRTPEENK